MMNKAFKNIKSLLILSSAIAVLSSCGGGGSTCPAYSQEYKFDRENEINLATDQVEISTENES